MNILVADDELRIRILVKDFLEAIGHSVHEVSNGIEAIDYIESHPDLHLVILDVMMPKCSGWEVMETIRPDIRVPVLMLTARSTEDDELTGFRLGVDDYIKKPFSPVLLLARVNALLQRAYGIESNLVKGALTINYANHSIYIRTNDIDEHINLSQKEFQLLSTLIENENQVLTRDQLLIKVWGYDYEGTERTVDTHMNRLRIKLKDLGDYIQTVRGYGYKFEITK